METIQNSIKDVLLRRGSELSRLMPGEEASRTHERFPLALGAPLYERLRRKHGTLTLN